MENLWLDDNDLLQYPLTLATTCIFNNNLDFLRYLVAEYVCNREGLELAAKNGHLNVVKLLYEFGSELFSSYILHLAIINGHTKVVEYLQNDFAIEKGDLYLVKYFHQQLREKCTRNMFYSSK
ncbi:hypothetical protein THRCLA_22875 [Thraustotheca clavata]|uniref:Uncharacterized protein n=1 Tax=Thraustotheca clavata TaxID=74557 RepID=A0A1V9YRL1_9STRA|nr:hypothetical protein THRCLA_22875 [Thraustotheca clavata]